ncbi:hybrid sensor histidine kinase/response regulator [Massilia niastensis]|uniref:hybrid sensor histidine kinase/response regulator n=1 Tax=Massilia niastensis TaxID=544911 RepID=UPI00036D1E6F|nr:ATP-binding protein [Massilia niastensis]
MSTFQADQGNSLQRASHDEGESVTGQALDQMLLRRIAALEDEVAVLRRESEEKRTLDCLVDQLREANENLVLAAINAQASREDAEETNRRQNEFLAMLAHELRNPLVPISMSANMLDRSADPDGQTSRLTQVIQRQVDHMAHLLDDLLDAARLSSGKITLATRPLDLKGVIDQALETTQPKIREREQHLELRLPPTPVTVDGDPVRLTQVFTNLLSNASKYTQDGGRIRVEVRGGDEIAVAISDNGSGMAPATIIHVFDLFAQGPRSLARSEGGLGIGLNVVRNLVTMHGGSVTAASAGPGRGSTFTVRLPLSRARVPDGPVQDERVATKSARRVLVVEDNPDACEVLRMLLEFEGHQVEVATDGPTGLQMALARPFDAIVCDIGLPGMDGFELIASLRAAGAAPLAVALSGYGQASDRERAFAAGFDRYLVKPVGPAALVEAVGTASPAR